MRRTRHLAAEDIVDVARATEAVLKAHRDPEIVSLPFLHFQSAHPNVTARYAPLFGDRPDIWSRLRSLLARARLYASAMAAGQALWIGDPLPDRADILFVSHFLRQGQAGSAEDLYVGRLPAVLGESGLASVTALIDHTRASRAAVLRAWRPASQPRILLARTIGLRNEVAIGSRLRRAARRLRAAGFPDPLEAAVARMAAGQATMPASRTALRMAIQIRTLVERLRPKVLMTTYEGHSWERLAFAAARDVDPDIRCVGYAHAVLFPLQQAMYARLGPRYDPDIILTGGDVTRDQLRHAPALRGIPIETLGSARISCLPQPVTLRREPVCVVLPEGLITECEALIRPIIRIAAKVSHVRFRIRLHPGMSREALMTASPHLQHLPANIFWSDSQRIEDDLSNARWALYRGSTAVFQALNHGVQPIYVTLPNEPFCIDPLDSLDVFRVRVSTEEELTLALFNEEIINEDMLKAKSFSCKYFMEMNSNIVSNLIYSVDS